MAAADRFTDLSDDLLVSLISFLPAKDAACTSALSRRWRGLWLGTDALNLDSTSYGGLAASLLKDRLFSDACAALRAAGRRPVRKLSLFVKGHSDTYCDKVMSSSSWDWWDREETYDLLVALLDVDELRLIEELRLVLHSDQDDGGYLYKLDPAVLPGNTLRVLDLTYCQIAPPQQQGAVLLPCLSVLRLRECSSPMKDLLELIRAAPSLGSLHIDSHDFYGGGDRFRLRSPSVIAVTLSGLHLWTKTGIELDTPCLRSFKYDGGFIDFSMISPAPELARVEVALIGGSYRYDEAEEPWFGTFWRIIRNFRHARILKLKVPYIEGIAVSKDVEHDHLVMLPGLERLELEWPFDPEEMNEADAATAIANLLQCCPVIQDLQIRIVNSNCYGVVAKDAVLPHFDVSMDLFKRRYTKEVTLMVDGDGDDFSDVAELPGLSGREFDCFRNHLKNVKLEFVFKESKCFEVSLAKFLAENCMTDADLQIVDGNHNFVSHINWTVERWRANAAEQRKQ